jgi:hypothetical protein
MQHLLGDRIHLEEAATVRNLLQKVVVGAAPEN